MYIAKREGFTGTWDYFETNVNDSPKWTKDKSKAAVFSNQDEAMAHANVSGLYTIILEVVNDNSTSEGQA
jgi:hypothetical protein